MVPVALGPSEVASERIGAPPAAIGVSSEPNCHVGLHVAEGEKGKLTDSARETVDPDSITSK